MCERGRERERECVCVRGGGRESERCVSFTWHLSGPGRRWRGEAGHSSKPPCSLVPPGPRPGQLLGIWSAPDAPGHREMEISGVCVGENVKRE